MKQQIIRMSEGEILALFPIAGLLEGWYFRCNEVTLGQYRADGTDLWGRSVSRNGSDYEGVLQACVKDAQDIGRQMTG